MTTTVQSLPHHGTSKKINALLVALLLFGATIAAFFVARFAGLWMNGDTLRLTQTIFATQSSGTLTPPGDSYQQGYGYPAVSVALLSATGLSVQQLQTQVYPFLAIVGVGVVAFALYSQVLGMPVAAVLATLMLLLQPDFLFVTLRGSHEKLGWPLMMLALLLLHRSLGQPLRRLAIYLVLFYAVVYAMIAVNVFFASVFLTAVSVGLGLGLTIETLRRRQQRPRADLRRLLYVVTSGGILVYIFITYLYAPALANLRLLRSIVEQVSALLLSFEFQAQPYNYIDFGWVSRPVYLGLTVFTWLLIVASLAEWLRRGWRLLRGADEFDLQANLDWLLYAGFAIQVGVSIVVDFAGVLGGNLQLRVFPGFTVLAVVLLAHAVYAIVTRLNMPRKTQRATLVLAGLAAAWFATAAVLKASNDPVVSNKWGFYSPQEASSLQWVDFHLTYSTVWTSFDERLSTAFAFLELGQPGAGNIIAGFTFKPEYQYVLYSDAENVRGLRMGLAMPAVIGWSRVYDSGQVYLYHERPVTPFQQ